MLRRALDAVQLVVLNGELSIREIGAALGLPKSTAHRLVSSLVSVRLLKLNRRPDGDAYAVGPVVAELNGGGFFWQPLVQHARPELMAVRDETGETVGLHVLHAERRVLLDQVVSHHEHRWVYGHLMVPMPLYAGAAAKMLLAMLPEESSLRLAAHDFKAAGHLRGSTDVKELVESLAVIRRQRYSLSFGEINAGINSIAVPVVSEPGGTLPLTVISLAAPNVRLGETQTKRCLRRMRAAADAIRARLQENS